MLIKLSVNPFTNKIKQFHSNRKRLMHFFFIFMDSNKSEVFPTHVAKALWFCFFFFFFNFIATLFIYLFIFGCVGSSVHARAFSGYGKWGPLFIAVRGPFTIAAPPVAGHRLSSCGSRAQPPRDMWDLPRPGLEPVSPALAGRFSTTAPPGKPFGSVCFHEHIV